MGVSWHCKSIGGILIMLDLLDLDISYFITGCMHVMCVRACMRV